MVSHVCELKLGKMEMNTGGEENAVDHHSSPLEAVYYRYANRIYTLALRLLAHDRAVAEDVTAQVFVRFSREINEWPDAAQRTFRRVRELAIREALLWLDSQEHKSESVAIAKPSAFVSARDERCASLPDNGLLLDRLSAQLPNPLRVAFVLHDREGIGTTAIAAYLRVNEPEARRLINNGRLEVRRLWLESTHRG